MPRGYGHGVAVATIDNDGHPDLFVTRWRHTPSTATEATGPSRTHRGRRTGRRPRLADLGRLRRPGRGRGSRPLRLPLRAWDADHPRLLSTTRKPNGRPTANRGRSRPSPIGSSETTGDGSSTCRPRPGSSTARPRPGCRRGGPRRTTARVDLFVANDTTANSLLQPGRAQVPGGAGSVRARRQRRQRLPGRHGRRLRRPRRRWPARPGRDQLLRRVDHVLPQPGQRLLRRHQPASGLAVPSRYLLGFGISFLDYDNDGHLDLATANGHVNDFRPSLPYAMPALLLAGSERGRFVDVVGRGRAALATRASAAAWRPATSITTAGSIC